MTKVADWRSHNGRTTMRSRIDAERRRKVTMAEKCGERQRQAVDFQRRARHHAAEHHEGALREIHDAASIIDDAKADADEAIDAADRDAAHNRLHDKVKQEQPPLPR